MGNGPPQPFGNRPWFYKVVLDWRFSVGLLTLISALAVIRLPDLQLEAFPDVSEVQVSVFTEVPGLAAQEIERLVSFPVESVMYALPQVRTVRSTSQPGLSIVTVIFSEGTDIYFARQLISERLHTATEQMPAGFPTPQIGPNTGAQSEVFEYRLVGAGVPLQELRAINDWLVRRQLLPVEGVTDVLPFGGEVRQFQLALDPNLMLAQSVNVEQIVSAVQRSNLNVGAWYLNRGPEQHAIRGIGLIRPGDAGLRDLERIPVKEFEGTVVRVADVARVRFGGQIRQGAVSMTQRDNDGRIQPVGEIVAGIVLKRFDANTDSTIAGVRERLNQIQTMLPVGVTVEPIYDQSHLVGQSMKSVGTSMAMAVGVVALLLGFTLSSVGAVVLVLAAIPFSVAGALIFAEFIHLSANLISLGGLAIAIGILVDAAVVMIDGVHRHVSRSTSEATAASALVELSLRQVARPLTAGLLALIAVLLPLLWLPGITGRMFAPMVTTLIAAETMALIFAILILPGVAVLWVRHTRQQQPQSIAGLWPAIESRYRAGVEWLLARPSWVLDALIVTAIATAVLVPRIGTEFVPEFDEGALSVRAVLPPTVSLDASLELAAKVERELIGLPFTQSAISHVGRAEVGGDPEPVSNIEVLVTFDGRSKRPPLDQLKHVIEGRLARFPGVQFSVSQPIAVRFEEMLSGVQADVAVKIFGEDIQILEALATQAQELIQGTRGARDVFQEPLIGDVQLTITPNRERLSRFGVSVSDVLTLISEAVGGVGAGEVLDGDRRFEIYARLDDDYRNSVDAISRLIIQSDSGRWVRLGDVADIEFVGGPLQIRRDQLNRRAVVQFNVADRDISAVIDEVQEMLRSELQLPTGYGLQIDGLHRLAAQSRRYLMTSVPLALAAIGLVLSVGFACWRRALLVMSAVPFSMCGSLIALVISGTYLSVPSNIGLLVVLGISMLNSSVLIAEMDRGACLDKDASQAMADAACRRLRPVLLTTGTTLIGLIPLLLSSGVGAELQQPLAITVAGGLVTSTILTLFALPALYGRWIWRSPQAQPR